MPQADPERDRTTERLFEIALDEAGLPPPTPEIEQERRVAIFDLIEGNLFALASGPSSGPYRLALRPEAHSIGFEVTTRDGALAAAFRLSAAPYLQVVRDYRLVCENYLDAVRHLSPGRIEAIDEARREIHEEGARILAADLSAQVRIDAQTARRLFTLVAVLRVAD
jgi:uncharacterized protein (UPF0262 family)